MTYQVIHSDCKEAIKELIAKGIQVDSIVTDPPYEISFMNKNFDKTGIAHDVELWKLCLQILKPGGHVLAFGATRTYHRLACAIEDAGFEIRDSIRYLQEEHYPAWIFAQGFPKSLNISKALDKMAGAERDVIGKYQYHDGVERKVRGSGSDKYAPLQGSYNVTTPSTDLAKQYAGYGSALKPAWEPIVMARKPLSEKNIASNVIKHGCGALNIDGCRVELSSNDPEFRMAPASRSIPIPGQYDPETPKDRIADNHNPLSLRHNAQGRFPANLIHDGSEEVKEEFKKFGELTSGSRKPGVFEKNSDHIGSYGNLPSLNSSKGTADRFFKETPFTEEEKKGRFPANLIHDGSEEVEAEFAKYGESGSYNTKPIYVSAVNQSVAKGKEYPRIGNRIADKGSASRFFYSAKASAKDRQGSKHPTVKPLSLMRYLCRLVTPKGGTVLDMFAGSGTTGQAALEEGFNVILIEKEAEYIEDINRRLDNIALPLWKVEKSIEQHATLEAE